MEEDKKTIVTLGFFFGIIGIITVGVVVLSIYLQQVY